MSFNKYLNHSSSDILSGLYQLLSPVLKSQGNAIDLYDALDNIDFNDGDITNEAYKTLVEALMNTMGIEKSSADTYSFPIEWKYFSSLNGEHGSYVVSATRKYLVDSPLDENDVILRLRVSNYPDGVFPVGVGVRIDLFCDGPFAGYPTPTFSFYAQGTWLADEQSSPDTFSFNINTVGNPTLFDLNPMKDEIGRRFVFKTYSGEIVNIFAMLQKEIESSQTVSIICEAIDSARNYQMNPDTFVNKINLMYGIENLNNASREVLSDITRVMSNGNPLGLINLIKQWIDKTNRDETTIDFMDAPPAISAICIASMAQAVISTVSTIISVAVSIISAVAGIVISVISAIFQSVVNAIGSAIGVDYSTVWANNTNADTDMRCINVPFYRGYLYQVGEAIVSYFGSSEIVKTSIPGAEIVMWIEDKETQKVAFEFYPSLDFNLISLLKTGQNSLGSYKYIGLSEEKQVFKVWYDADRGFVALNPGTDKATMNELIDAAFDPVISYRQLSNTEIECRIASALCILAYSFLFYNNSNSQIPYFSNSEVSKLALTGISRTQGTEGGRAKFANTPFLLFGLEALATVVYTYRNTLLDLSQGTYPVDDHASDAFSLYIINDLISGLTGDPTGDRATFENQIGLSVTSFITSANIFNSFYLSDYDAGYSRVDDMEYSNVIASQSLAGFQQYPDSFIKVIVKDAVDGGVQVTDNFLSASYKGIPFVTVPKHTIGSIIAGAVLGGIIVATVAAVAYVGYRNVKRKLTMKQLASQSSIAEQKERLEAAARSGDLKAYKQEYKKYNRMVRKYNMMSSITGQYKYNKNNGFYEDMTVRSDGSYSSGLVSKTYSGVLDAYGPGDDIDNKTMFENIYSIITGSSLQ